jgi:Domain of unknown function (DUF4389)
MPHPIQVVVTDDLKRNRLTVFFRALLVIPHWIVLSLWTIVAELAILIAWFAALITGRVPTGLHNFIGAWLRYTTHVYAYMFLLADPYPPFSGSSTYPVDLEIAPPEPQSRWKTFFRIILAIPALIIASVLRYLGLAIAIIGWFASLFLGRMPKGLRDTGAWTLRVDQQTYAYTSLLTDKYPQFGPTPEPDAAPGSV